MFIKSVTTGRVGRDQEQSQSASPEDTFYEEEEVSSMGTTKRQNELYNEVCKLFSQSSTDAPALMPCAMLPTSKAS